MSWENIQGLWDVLVDGAVMVHGSAWGQSLSVRPGKLVVGQSQGVFGGGFTVGESFKGKVASLNVWSTKMTNSMIKERAKSCSHELGNVVDWRTFKHGAHGDVGILSPQSCISHGKRDLCLSLHSTPLHSTPKVRKFYMAYFVKKTQLLINISKPCCSPSL